MTITVKFFARLREELGKDSSRLAAPLPATVQDAWHSASGRSELPDDIFCAINHEHANFADPVKDGDEVAFFPRVTGG